MIRRTIQLGALLVAALAVGCSGTPGAPGDATTKKDIPRLKALMKSPSSCRRASDCPTGSYCDDGAGTCKVECYLSSHCGSEAACSADGHCIARSSLSPAERFAFAAAASTSNRKLGDSCVYDQECPKASYCDTLDHVCRRDCAAGGPTCATGFSCSSVGRCVDPKQLPDLPQLVLSPGSVQLIRAADAGTADQRVQRVLVQLKTANKEIAAGKGVTPHAQVQPDSGVEVACPNPGTGTTAPASGFGTGCSLQAWTYTADASGGGFTAQREVWIRLANVDASASQWSVLVRSRDVSANVDHIVVALPDPLRTSGFDGEYRGDLFLEGSQLAATATSPALAQLSVPVTAVANAQGFLIFDPTGLAAPTGALFYQLGSSSGSYVETWLSARAATGTSTEPIADTGAVTATIARTTPDLAIVGDLVRGYLNVSLALSGTKPMKWRFELHRVGAPHAACQAGTACPALQTCDPRLLACVPSGATPAGTVTAGNSLVQQRMLKVQGDVASRYAAAISDNGGIGSGDELGDGMKNVPNIYTTAISVPTLAGTLLFDQATVSDQSALKKLGYNICGRDFAIPASAPTIGGRTTPAASDPSCTGTAAKVAVSTLTKAQICDQLYSVTDDWWARCVAPTHTDTHAKVALRRSFVPCFSATDGSVPAAQTCQNLYQIEFNGDTNYASYTDFMAHACLPAPASLYTSSGAEVQVYLCPEASRLAFGDSATDAELTACFDPTANAGVAFLRSAQFSSSVTQSSGDIQCVGGKPLTEVPLLDAPRDLTPGTVGSPDDDAGAMYANCLAELSRELPPSLGLTGRDALKGALAPGHCINLAQFVASVEVARQSFPTYYLDLLRRWTSLHAFVAQQGRVQWQSSRVLADLESGHAAEGSDTAIYDLIDRLDHGWDYLLSPANSDYLAGLRSYLVSNPDYRQAYHVPANLPADHEQTAALSVALFDSLVQYLNVVDAYVEIAGTAAYADCQAHRPINADIRARIAASLRYAGAVERLTEMLASKNYNSAQATKVARARAEYRSTIARIAASSNALLECKNPLGINEQDLPLFYRDAQTTNNRYLASSDYLNTLLAPAIKDASDALSAAQAAWDKARTTRIQAGATDNDFQNRLESVQAKYGAEIMTACGITDMNAEDVLAAFDPSKPNARSLASCQLNAGCDPTSTDPSCYRGTIGEAIVTIHAAKQDIDLARRTWQDAQNAFDLEATYCKTLQADLAGDDVLTQKHNTTMNGLRAEKLTVDIITNFLDGAEKCASAATASFGAACGPAIGEAVTKTLSDSFEVEMQEEEASYQAELQQRKNAREAAACFHEADLKHVGISTAQATISRRGTDAALAMLRLRNLREHVQQQLAEGLAVLARERGRKLPSVAHHYWYDDAVVDFSHKMLRAKKLLFLFSQAVEYETQSSIASRPAMVQAIQPNQLNVLYNALTDTDSSYNTRTLHGRPVQSTVAVLSVCSELIGFTDPATTPFGAATCLTDYLSSPQAAVYDNAGKYLGQAVSFSLTPDHSDFDGLYGERVWYVSATASGESGMAQVPNGRLVVFKRNVFFDRWIPISGVGDGTQYQIGRARPSGYLFDVQPGSSNQVTDASSFLSTVLQPKWNMKLEDFQDPRTLPPGASDALAGRGIYGDYIVLFPATAATDKNYIDLTKVDDVLLRFDFLAASYVNK